MMKPTSIKILCYNYKIKYDKNLIAKQSLIQGNNISGYCDKDNLIIVIDPDLDIQLQKETLMHEILHAAFMYVVLAISSPCEEDFVTIGAPILCHIFQDNPQVRQFIFNEENGSKKKSESKN